MKLRDNFPWKKNHDKPRQHIKKQRHHFTDKGQYNQSYGFSSSHEWMWESDHKEGWLQKNWCFQNVVLEKTLVSPLDSKEIQWVNPKGNQPWIFIGRTDAEAEAPIHWPPDGKSQLIGKDLMLGKIEGWRKRDDSGWDVWIALPTQWAWVWVSSVRRWNTGILACCSPWVTESDVTEALNNKGQGMALCRMGDKSVITGDTRLLEYLEGWGLWRHHFLYPPHSC